LEGGAKQGSVKVKKSKRTSEEDPFEHLIKRKSSKKAKNLDEEIKEEEIKEEEKESTPKKSDNKPTEIKGNDNLKQIIYVFVARDSEMFVFE
jgi:hypothetical protein